jgi:3-oxoacyl-[acyl-carrier protein] reductase
VFLEEQATVVGLDVDEDGLGELEDEAADMPGELETYTCDLTDRDEVSATVDAIREDVNPVDVLVNNAGLIDAVGKVEDYDDELWDRDIEVNMTGTYNITKPIFKGMCERGWGRIISMSSVAGWLGGFGQLSYSSTKSGLIGFGKTLALEGAQQGVTSNIIAPNIVMEDLADLPGEELEEINPQFEKIRQATPMKKLGKEKDVSNLIAFLASEQSEYITGQVIGVTGGVDLFSF